MATPNPVRETTDEVIIATGNTEVQGDAAREVDENGMTRDDIFDQLADESHVVTSGKGSSLPRTVSAGGTSATGYSSGVGSGSGSDS